MKRSLAIAALFTVLALFSCKDTPNTLDKHGETVVEKYKSTEQFADHVSLQTLQQAVTTFRLTNGRFPKDIEELAEFSGEPLDSNKYDYDPSTGTIALKN